MSHEVLAVAPEGMLDEAPFAVLYAVLVLISDVCSLFFIFTVITRSPADMRLYKYMLLKLAICDLLFNLSIAVLVSPDLLCPLSAVAVRSPIGGISESHAFITMAITVAIFVTVFSSINDCCFIRVCIFYQWNAFLQKVYSWKGALFLFFANVVAISVIVLTLWLAVNTNKEFLEVVKAENMTHALGSYASQPSTVYFYIDIWRPRVLPLLVSVVVGLAAIHIMNLLASRLVWKGICTRKKNMSFKSYQNHRQLTLLVLSQNLLPAAALSVPLVIVIFSFVMRYESDAFAELIKHFVTLTVAIYPALSVILSFVFIQPYRTYLFSFFCRLSMRRMSHGKISDVRMSRKESLGNEQFEQFGYI